MMTDVTAMQASDWITLGLGLAAFATAIWSNKISREALKTTGKQRVAEFRKEWIENLRLHLAEYYSLANRRLVLRLANEVIVDVAKGKELVTGLKDNHTEINTTYVRSVYLKSYIALMLNPNEEQHKNLEVLMGQTLSSDLSEETLRKLLSISRSILKSEWDRLKIEFN